MRTPTPLLLALPLVFAWAGFTVGQTPDDPNQDIGAADDSANVEEEAASDFPPKKFDARRYDAIFKRNPFLQEVVPVAEEKAEDPWADSLTLRSVSRIGGQFVVHVEDTKLAGDEDPDKRRQAYHRLTEGQSAGDLRIQSVKPHRDPAQVEVVLVTGSGAAVKTATIKYGDKQLKPKAPPATARPTPGQPNPSTTRRPVAPTTTPDTSRSTTPGKRRVILPPGLQGK